MRLIQVSDLPVRELKNVSKADLQNVQAFVSDIDGVLTDGGIFLLEPGQWRRRFFIHDGLGLKQMVESGIKVALISGSRGEDISERAAMLGIDSVFQGVEQKLPVLMDFLARSNISLSNTIYIGDDLPDLPILDVVGFPITVPNAHRRLLQNSRFFVTKNPGGAGAVREVSDILLEAKGV